MNAWLLRASWWQLALAMGAVLAPFLVLLFGLTGDRSWPAALVAGLGVTVVCAPMLGVFTEGVVQDSMAAAGDLPAEDGAVVERASRRGPVPADDALREAALRLVEDRLLTMQATRSRALATSAVLVAVTAVMAVTRSPWWWLGVAASTAALALALAAPARLRRRAEVLRSPDR